MTNEFSNNGTNGNMAKYFLGGLLFGAAIGGTVALLYAPMKGEDTRRMLKEKAVSAEKTVQGKAVQIKNQANEMAAGLRDKLCDTAGDKQ